MEIVVEMEAVVDMVEAAVVAVDLFLKSNAPQLTNKFAQVSPSKAVDQSQGRSVLQHLNSSVALFLDNNVDQFQDK